MLTISRATSGSRRSFSSAPTPAGPRSNLRNCRPDIWSPLQREFFNSDNTGAALADVHKLPRLEGAKDDPARSSSDSLVYSVARPLAETIAALRKMFAADGWKEYVAPLEETHQTLLTFKKGPQGLSVSFTIQVGEDRADQRTDDSLLLAGPIGFALAIPDDATDIVFDEIGLISIVTRPAPLMPHSISSARR